MVVLATVGEERYFRPGSPCMNDCNLRINTTAPPPAVKKLAEVDREGTSRHLVERVMADLFPGTDDPFFKRRVEALLGFVTIVRHHYLDGPVRQTLIHVFNNPAWDVERVVSREVRASLRIELADGMVYALSFGGTSSALDRAIAKIGRWLAGRAYDEAAFERHQAELNSILRTDAMPEQGIRVTFELNAAISIYPQVGVKMVLKSALAILNDLRAELGMPERAELPQFLMDYFQYQSPTRNDESVHFRDRLDQDVLRQVKLLREGAFRQLGELALYNYFACSDSTRVRYRRQAADAFPLLLPILLEPTRPAARRRDGALPNEGPPHRRAIQRAIDEGKPLFKSIAGAFSVPSETVRWLAGKELPVSWMINSRRLGLLIRLLSWVAPEKRPRNEEEFELLHRFGRAFAGALQFVGPMDGEAAIQDPAFAFAARRWLSELQPPGFSVAAVMADDGQFERDVVDARDFLAALYQALLLHCEPSLGASDVRVDMRLRFVYDWARSLSHQQFLSASRRWHEALITGTPEAGDERAVLSWPAVLEEPLRVGPVTVVELTDQRALVEEGRRLQHCVGSYGDTCLRRDGMVVSVRNAEGKSCSTAALQIAAEPPVATVIQHRGAQNGPVSADCDAAIAALEAYLNRPENAEKMRTRLAFQYRERLKAQHAGWSQSRQAGHGEAGMNAAMSVVTGRHPPFVELSLHELYATTGARRIQRS